MKIKEIILHGLLIITLTIIVANRISAQDKLLVSDRFPEMKYSRVVGDVYYNEYVQIKGNAFLTEDWSKGDILLKDGHTIIDIQFKIDAYKQRLLIYQEYLKRIVILDKHLIQSFTLFENGESMQFILEESYKTRANSDDGSFLEVLLKDSISLYKLYSRDVTPLGGSQGVFLDEFNDEINYYIYENGKYEHVRISKSFLINRYPQFKDEMKRFIRKERLHVKKEKDFVLALLHLGELVQKADE